MLSQDVERYVELRRIAGFKYTCEYTLLKGFATFAEAAGDTFVQTDRVLEWVARVPSPHQRRRRLLAVRQFAMAMHTEDRPDEVPPKDVLVSVPYRRPPPYIYTPEEIARLMAAMGRLGPPGSIRPLMYTTLIGLLAATGLRISEALALRIKDVTDDGLLILETKFKKSRLVPLHDTTRQALDVYLSVRTRVATASDALFISMWNDKFSLTTVGHTFQSVAKSVGLTGHPGRRAPRLHDLRHTFAVRSLEQCPHDRNAVHRHILALSTYLGHAKVHNTYWYLEATPVLLRQIAEAGENLYQRGVS